MCFKYDPFRRIVHLLRERDDVDCYVDLAVFEADHPDPGFHRVECNHLLLFKYDVQRGIIDYKYRQHRATIDIRQVESRLRAEIRMREGMRQRPPTTLTG